MDRTPNGRKNLLPFETLSQVCYDSNNELLRDKVKAMIKLFRPDRRGFLTKLDFVSSVDNVYKDLRLFRASLANSSSIDDSFATIINSVFYFVVILIVLLIVGFQSGSRYFHFRHSSSHFRLCSVRRAANTLRVYF